MSLMSDEAQQYLTVKLNTGAQQYLTVKLNTGAEISTTFPHQAATPKQQMLKWRHHSSKWSTKSNADDRLH